MDSRGRLFVGDRSNNRIQIFDQDGNYLEEWNQFSRPSGIFIDKNDVIYVADSESGSVAKNPTAGSAASAIGKLSDGKVTAFIPDPGGKRRRGTSAAEGVAADAAGNIYGAEVGKGLMKYSQLEPSRCSPLAHVLIGKLVPTFSEHAAQPARACLSFGARRTTRHGAANVPALREE